jgi:dolichol kinase
MEGDRYRWANWLDMVIRVPMVRRSPETERNENGVHPQDLSFSNFLHRCNASVALRYIRCVPVRRNVHPRSLLCRMARLGNMLFEAMAREKDEPHRTFFILVPYFTTLIGGLVSNILFGSIAVAGYLVTGLGDAIGEPAGTMFGKHHYRVRSLSSVPATRSVEGSTAVFIMSVIALGMAAAVSPYIILPALGVLKLLFIAGACTLAEALSPHG